MPSALTALAARLDVPPDRLDSLAGVAEKDLAVLDAAVAAVLQADDDAIQAGLEGALHLIPRPLRGRAAKVLMPEEDA